MQRVLFKAREARKRKYKTISADRTTEEAHELAVEDYSSEDQGKQIPLADNQGEIQDIVEAIVDMDVMTSPQNSILSIPTSPTGTSSPSVTTPTAPDVQVPICNCTQTQIVQEYRRLNHALNQKIRRLEQKVVELKQNQKENTLPSFTTVLGESENKRFSRIVEQVLTSTIKGDRYFRMWGRLRAGKMLGKLAFCFDSDVCQDAIIKLSKNWLRENVFHPASQS
jgi:DNA topoisomerase VI subunit B